MKNGELSIEEVIAILRLRVKIYSILKHLFLEEPTENYLKSLVEDKFLSLLMEKYSNEDLREAIGELLKEATDILSGNRKKLLEIWTEYTRLFIGPIQPVVYPFESVYRGGEMLKGKLWLQVRDWMLDDGFILENRSVLEDHVGIELEYVMLTSLNIIKMLENNKFREASHLLNRQKDFLKEHVLCWVPKLCKEIEEKSGVPFYRAFARLVNVYLNDDVHVLELLNECLTERI